MRNAVNYKTAWGLYKATIKALETLEGTAKGWWLQNALYCALEIQKDEKLYDAIKNLIKGTAPRTIGDLKLVR